MPAPVDRRSRSAVTSTGSGIVRLLRAAPVRTVLILLAALPALAVGFALTRAATGTATTTGDKEMDRMARTIRKDIDTLASDAMEGRGLDTGGIKKAADYLERRLKAIGLKPAFAGSYRQKFPVKVGVRLLPGNQVEGIKDDDWTPLGFSSPGDFTGELAFVGYGIEAPSLGFRELDGVDLKRKVALMLRYEPQEKDDDSPFDGRKPSRWSALRYKAMQARERGAVAVIFVTGPLQDEEKEKLPALKNDGPESPAGLPILQVKTAVAEAWLAKAGIDLKKFQDDVDRDLTPRSKGTTGVTLRGTVAVEPLYVDTENVAGVLPGRGALDREVLVLGAHYDHLGYGGERSMKPNLTEIHNGADDNASGCATVLAAGEGLVRSLAAEKAHRTLVLAFFSGEEVGLAGSSWFVDHPPFPIADTVAMINLDMVGRLRDKLVLLGPDTAPEWRGLIAQAKEAVPGLDASGQGDGYGPSDQTAFYGKRIPVLHLFTGAHEQYHTPDDDPATIDAGATARVGRFTEALGREVATEPAKLTYVPAGAAPLMSGDSRGYGAYLGTIPDYRAMEATEGGVLLADVRKGGPADLAGIQGGDRIVEMAGTRIENLYDMTYALQDHKPAETISVVVIRNNSAQTLKATLGDRAKMAVTAEAKPSGTPTAASDAAGSKDAKSGAAAAAKEGSPAAPPSTDAASPDAKAIPAEVTKPPTPTPEKPAAPPSPHSAGMEEKKEEGGVAAFYTNRPGASFAAGAGKPYGKTFDGERHLKEIRQLTFGGENAEPYFAPDGRHIIFQATLPDTKCDRQFVMDLATGETKPVSSGKGRTTCGYFDYPEADRIVYASTESGGAECPPPPDHSQGYVWAIYDTYEVWEARPDGSGARPITSSPGYDAEMTWCHRGGKMIFTSVRDGDLDLYVMDETGETKRITKEPGYDGGAFFSPDCREITWRASRPRGKDLEEYKGLLAKNLVRPSNMQIYVAKADGTGAKQLTDNGAANFCPTFTADGTRILYASNAGSKGGREFDLYLIPKTGGDPERITFSEGFDGFPHFSPDGTLVVWSSNRADPASHQTNLFIAKWAD